MRPKSFSSITSLNISGSVFLQVHQATINFEQQEYLSDCWVFVVKTMDIRLYRLIITSTSQ